MCSSWHAQANKIRKYAHNVAKLRKLGADEAGLMLFDDRCVVKGQDQALAAAIEAIVPCKCVHRRAHVPSCALSTRCVWSTISVGPVVLCLLT